MLPDAGMHVQRYGLDAANIDWASLYAPTYFSRVRRRLTPTPPRPQLKCMPRVITGLLLPLIISCACFDIDIFGAARRSIGRRGMPLGLAHGECRVSVSLAYAMGADAATMPESMSAALL